MTFVGVDRVDFFEAFDSKHSWAHDANLEECELVSSQGALAIQAKSSTIGRWISFGISFDAVKIVRQIVELAKATLNAHDSNSPEERILSKYRAASRTCLLIARKEKCEELNELGKRFLNLEAEKRKQDPLYVACQNRTFHVALDLLKAEPQKIGIAFGSYTDLLRLAFEQKEYRLCRQFIHLGADPNAAFGLNVANAASLLLVDAIKEGQEKVAIILVEVGADLTVHKEGKSPLHYAAGQGFCRLADTMIQRGADVLEVDDSLNSPLHEAARGYHADMVRLLIQHGSNIAELNRDKQCALMLPESFGDKERAADFYLRVLSQYKISRDLLLEQGIHGFLAECQEVPAKLIHGLSGPNPFELALFFQDSTLAKNIARDMPLSRFYQYVKKLQAKYPHCNLDLIEFCYLAPCSNHLENRIARLEVKEPSQNIELEELLKLTKGPNIRHVQTFIDRIRRKAEMPALMNKEAEKNNFYRLLELCIKNILLAVQHADQIRRETVVRELVGLEQGEHCAGRYFGVITKLYRTLCADEPKNFPEEIAIRLALHREVALERCTNSQSDYNYLLAHLGKELNIPGHETCSYYQDLCGQCDHEAAKEHFFKLYTVASIVKDCIQPALEHGLQDAFIDWMVMKMPENWAFALRQTLLAEMAKEINTPEHLREFLRRNGVSIGDDSTEYMQAFEAARKKAYIEKELLEHGKIRPQAICRMLSLMGVVQSEKLDDIVSPSTFAADWLLEIIDMVRH